MNTHDDYSEHTAVKYASGKANIANISGNKACLVMRKEIFILLKFS